MYTGLSSDVLCGRTAGCLVCFSSCLWLVQWTEDSLRLENLLSHLCGWEWASAVLTINVLGMTCWLCGNQETKMFRATNVALHKLAAGLREKYCFMQKMAAVFLFVQRLAMWVDRNGQLEGKQTRCEVEANAGLLSTASSFFFLLFFLWISLLMWRLLFFHKGLLFSELSTHTGGEAPRVFVGSVRQLCCNRSIRGDSETRNPQNWQTLRTVIGLFFYPSAVLGWDRNQVPFYWLPYFYINKDLVDKMGDIFWKMQRTRVMTIKYLL